MSESFLSGLHADPWNDRLVDLPSLNASASDSVESAVHSLKAEAAADPASLRSESMVFLGPPGVGKTHLFSRLRKKLGPRAVFVHIRPLLHAGLTPAFVLDQAVMQLANASYGHPQADALVGSILAHTNHANVAFPSMHLSEVRELPESERAEKLEEAVDQVLEIFPDLDDVFVERLLQLPFCSARVRRASLAWLAGQDCDPSQLKRIGAASSMGSEHAVRALRTLGCVAALGSPLVLVFDQLENLVQKDREEESITQYGNLIAELVDATRGLLVVQMALDSEWEQGIEPRLNLSQRSRVVMKKSSIALPTPEQNRQLLELWHLELEAPEGPLPWPFRAAALDDLVSLPGLTPRMLLSALREAREGEPVGILGESAEGSAPDSGPPVGEVPLSELLQEDWDGRLVSAHHALDQAEARRGGIDKDRLCDGILTAADFSPESQLKGTKNAHVQMEPVTERGGWVAVLHQSHHKSVGAALDRVLARPECSRGVVVREQWRPFSPTWKGTLSKQLEVLGRASIRWFDLNREDAVNLLCLEEFVQAARSNDICDRLGRPISEQVIRDFIASDLQPEQWPLLRELQRVDSPIELEDNPQQSPELVPRTTEGCAPPSELRSQLRSIIGRLRVASVDRLIREARRVDSGAGRAAVMKALEALGTELTWHGRNIVAVEEEL